MCSPFYGEEQFMSYGKFERIEQVSDQFEIKVKRAFFIDVMDIKVDEFFLVRMRRALLKDVNFVNEDAVRQHIIAPILDIVSDNYDKLEVWSEGTITVDEKLDLDGKPDYLIAPYADNGGISTPPICVIEAKEKDWKKGWAQALAEMYAVSTQSENICYGVVTTGEFWLFGRLEEGKIFTRDPIKLSAIENLQKVLNTLNWLFKKASEQIQFT
jgi:predicted type IV restriction endonuclease